MKASVSTWIGLSCNNRAWCTADQRIAARDIVGICDRVVVVRIIHIDVTRTDVVRVTVVVVDCCGGGNCSTAVRKC